MAIETTVSLVRSDYMSYSGAVIAVPLSEKQAAVVSSLLVFVLDRRVWDDMSDSEWDELDKQMSELVEKLMP